MRKLLEFIWRAAVDALVLFFQPVRAVASVPARGVVYALFEDVAAASQFLAKAVAMAFLCVGLAWLTYAKVEQVVIAAALTALREVTEVAVKVERVFHKPVRNP